MCARACVCVVRYRINCQGFKDEFVQAEGILPEPAQCPGAAHGLRHSTSHNHACQGREEKIQNINIVILLHFSTHDLSISDSEPAGAVYVGL